MKKTTITLFLATTILNSETGYGDKDAHLKGHHMTLSTAVQDCSRYTENMQHSVNPQECIKKRKLNSTVPQQDELWLVSNGSKVKPPLFMWFG